MTRAEDWHDIGVASVEAFEAVDDGGQGAMAYSYMLTAIGRLYGWADSRCSTYLAKLYSLRKADGGWGLESAFDVFGDGSSNPATTTYLITIGDQVGRTLLEARAAGLAVPLSDISTLVDLAMTTSTCTFSGAGGKAISYSRSTNDTVSTTNNRDVHNVAAGAAWFLQAAQQAGVAYSGLNKRINDLTRHLVSVYQPASSKGAWWPYRGPSSVSDSDTDHVAIVAECTYAGLCYPLGREVAYNVLAHGFDDEPNARIAWARLAGLPPGPGSMSSDGTTTLWLELADPYMADVANFGATASSPPRRAQIAHWAARAADQAAVVF